MSSPRDRGSVGGTAVPGDVGPRDHLDWLALLQVRSGQVSKRDDRYLYRGQPFSDVSLVAVALHGLQQAGLVTLAEPDAHGLATVALTEVGLARYKALIERQRARPDP